TDSQGWARFTDIAKGTVSGSVILDNFTSAYFTTNLLSNSEDDVVTNASTTIPVFSLIEAEMATVNGKGIIELNLTNEQPESVPDGTRVHARIRTEQSAFMESFVPELLIDARWPGKLDNITYSGITNNDGFNSEGSFSIQVPASTKGLPIELTFEDINANQQIAVNSIAGEADTIPYVANLQAVFGNNIVPDEIIPNGISPIQVYVEPPRPTGSGAAITPMLRAKTFFGQNNPTDFPVLGVHYEVVSGGSGYRSNAEVPVTVTQNFFNEDITGSRAIDMFAITNDQGEVIGLNVRGPGFGYRGTNTVEIMGAGSGAAIKILYQSEIAEIGNDLSIPDVGSVLDSAGNNYFIDPVVVIIGNTLDSNGDSMRVNDRLTNALDIVDGRIQPSGNLFNSADKYISPPDIFIVATPTVQASVAIEANDGSLMPTIIEPGLGYDLLNPPNASIIDLLGGVATGNAGTLSTVVSGSEVSEVVVTSNGVGYSERSSTNFNLVARPFQILGNNEPIVFPGKTYQLVIDYGTGLRTVLVE
ncbi:MAG: hypothetical protein AAFQ94_29980, partial [Bacteroidota bacterium]